MARGKYHHGDLRNGMILAALELMSEGGVAALTLRAAARRAGVSPAAPYRHFEDKAALLAAVAEQGFNELLALMDEASEAYPDNPLLAFQEVAVAYLRFALERSATLRVMFGPEVQAKGRYPELEAVRSHAAERLVAVIRKNQEMGLIREGDPMDIAVHTWSSIHGGATLLMNQAIPVELTGEELVAKMSRWLFIGLAPGEWHRGGQAAGATQLGDPESD